MPRQPDGSFQRFNDQYYGFDVWQQDLDTDKKIIALRHDVHDEDLAIGISQCLPKDGSELMLGNLQMGGFKVTKMANADNLEPDSAAAFGQTITDVTFNNSTRIMTLVREGMTDLGVTIPTDGDTNPIDVGVNTLIMGTGLVLLSGQDRVNPANPSDTILLKNTGVSSGAYSNANIIVDLQGRITQASTGTSPSVAFTLAQGSTNSRFTVAGINNDLQPAVATGEVGARAGGMSADQAKQLADAVAGIGTDLSITGHAASQLDIHSSTQIGGDLAMPMATNQKAGLMSSALFNQLQAAVGGDPDQNLGLGAVTSSVVPLLISGGTGVDLPLATSLLAGLMSDTQFKQISGLAVDGGGLTQPMFVTQNTSSRNQDITDHTDTKFHLDVWKDDQFLSTPQRGTFSGTITNAAPGSVGGEPEHHVWFVY